MRNNISTSFNDIQFIDANEKSFEKYGLMYGSSDLVITSKMLKELLNGKAIAMNDGEYSTFIVLDDELIGDSNEH